MKPSLSTGSFTSLNVTTSTSTSSLRFVVNNERYQLSTLGHPNQNSTIKDNLRMAWHGVESLLQKAERSVAGTPFQSPIAAVNVLIELGNVCPVTLFCYVC